MMLTAGCEQLKIQSNDVGQVHSRVFSEALKHVNALSEAMKQKYALEITEKFVCGMRLWMFRAENAVSDVKHALKIAAENVKDETHHFKSTMAMKIEDLNYDDFRVMKDTTAEQIKSLSQSERELCRRALEKAKYVTQKLEVHSAQLEQIAVRLLDALENWLTFASEEIQRFASNLQEKISSASDSLVSDDSTESSKGSESNITDSLCNHASNANDVIWYAQYQWERCTQTCEEKISLELSGTFDMLDKEIDQVIDEDGEGSLDVEELHSDAELRTRRFLFSNETFVDNLQHDIKYGGLYGAYQALSELRSTVLKRFPRASETHHEELAVQFV